MARSQRSVRFSCSESAAKVIGESFSSSVAMREWSALVRLSPAFLQRSMMSSCWFIGLGSGSAVGEKWFYECLIEAIDLGKVLTLVTVLLAEHSFLNQHEHHFADV